MMRDEIWIEDEFHKRLDKLMNTGKVRINEIGKIEPMARSQFFNTPWIFVKRPTDRWCTGWDHIYYEIFGFVPKFCAERCFKVVVYPKTCKQLFDVYDKMVELDLPSKIGLEIRDYVPSKKTNYGAYFYFDGEPAAKEGETLIRSVIDEIDPGIEILIKKSCTEMEMDENAAINEEWEKRLDDIMARWDEGILKQADWMTNKTMIFWLKYARTIGDETYKEVAELPADKTKYKTYHVDQRK